jgi:2,3-bisphosphoglycerate-dependent phosphoglycerate mutase
MQFYIIRHCQSENNALWKQTGSEHGRSSDPALTDLGHQQAQVLADFLARSAAQGPVGKPDGLGDEAFGITHLYCSLMRRSVQTATYIAEALDLPLIARDDIHERGGIYQKNPHTEINEGLPGPNRDHFQTHHPELILPQSVSAEGWWNRTYEEKEDALQRATLFLAWLEDHHGDTDDRVAIVSHGGFIQSLFSILLGTTLVYEGPKFTREIWIKSNNGSISRVDFWEDGIRFTYLNRVDFFPPHLVT